MPGVSGFRCQVLPGPRTLSLEMFDFVSWWHRVDSVTHSRMLTAPHQFLSDVLQLPGAQPCDIPHICGATCNQSMGETSQGFYQLPDDGALGHFYGEFGKKGRWLGNGIFQHCAIHRLPPTALPISYSPLPQEKVETGGLNHLFQPMEQHLGKPHFSGL